MSTYQRDVGHNLKWEDPLHHDLILRIRIIKHVFSENTPNELMEIELYKYILKTWDD